MTFRVFQPPGIHMTEVVEHEPCWDSRIKGTNSRMVLLGAFLVP